MARIPVSAHKVFLLCLLVGVALALTLSSPLTSERQTVHAQATPTPCATIAAAAFSWKQTDAAWANKPYASLTGTADKFSRWGSGVTSLAMLLAHAGVATDPGKLNDWMRVQPHAYGPRGSVNFSRVVAELTRSSMYTNPTHYFDQSHVGLSSAAELATLLCKGYPVLLMVDNPYGGKHYVVALAKEGNTFRIADPAYNVTRLNQAFNVPAPNGGTMAYNYQNRFFIRGFVASSNNPTPVAPASRLDGNGQIRHFVVTTEEGVEFNFEGYRSIGYRPQTKSYMELSGDNIYIKEPIGGVAPNAGSVGGANLLSVSHHYNVLNGQYLKFYGERVGATVPLAEFYWRANQYPERYSYNLSLREGLSGAWLVRPGGVYGNNLSGVWPTSAFAYKSTLTASATQVPAGGQVTFKFTGYNLGPDVPHRGNLRFHFAPELELISVRGELFNYDYPVSNDFERRHYYLVAPEAPSVTEIVARVKNNVPVGTKLLSYGYGSGDTIEGTSLIDTEVSFRVFQLNVSYEIYDSSSEITVSAAPSFIAGGLALQSNRTPVAGVTFDFQPIRGTGATPTAVRSDALGKWQQAGFAPGTVYRITPRKAGYAFNPAYREVGATHPGMDFTARQVQLFQAGGLARKAAGQPFPNVVIGFQRVAGTGPLPLPVLTDANGKWTQTGFEVGTQYLVIASQSGAFFLPPTRNFAAENAQLDFVGDTFRPMRAAGFVMDPSGRRIANAKIIFELRSGIGPIPAPVFTDANGRWEQGGFQRGALYGASASLTGYAFAPALMTFSTEVNDLNCRALVDPFTVSGTVRTANGTAVPNVALTFTRVSGTGATPAAVMTDSRGVWTQTGFRAGTTYRVTPSKAATQFDRGFAEVQGPVNDLHFRVK